MCITDYACGGSVSDGDFGCTGRCGEDEKDAERWRTYHDSAMHSNVIPAHT